MGIINEDIIHKEKFRDKYIENLRHQSDKLGN